MVDDGDGDGDGDGEGVEKVRGLRRGGGSWSEGGRLGRERGRKEGYSGKGSEVR